MARGISRRCSQEMAEPPGTPADAPPRTPQRMRLRSTTDLSFMIEITEMLREARAHLKFMKKKDKGDAAVEVEIAQLASLERRFLGNARFAELHESNGDWLEQDEFCHCTFLHARAMEVDMLKTTVRVCCVVSGEGRNGVHIWPKSSYQVGNSDTVDPNSIGARRCFWRWCLFYAVARAQSFSVELSLVISERKVNDAFAVDPRALCTSITFGCWRKYVASKKLRKRRRQRKLVFADDASYVSHGTHGTHGTASTTWTAQMELQADEEERQRGEATTKWVLRQARLKQLATPRSHWSTHLTSFSAPVEYNHSSWGPRAATVGAAFSASTVSRFDVDRKSIDVIWEEQQRREAAAKKKVRRKHLWSPASPKRPIPFLSSRTAPPRLPKNFDLKTAEEALFQNQFFEDDGEFDDDAAAAASLERAYSNRVSGVSSAPSPRRPATTGQRTPQRPNFSFARKWQRPSDANAVIREQFSRERDIFDLKVGLFESARVGRGGGSSSGGRRGGFKEPDSLDDEGTPSLLTGSFPKAPSSRTSDYY